MNTKAPKYLCLLYVGHGFLSFTPTGWCRQLLSPLSSILCHSPPPSSQPPRSFERAKDSIFPIFKRDSSDEQMRCSHCGVFETTLQYQNATAAADIFLAQRQWWQCQAPWLKLLKRGIRVALIAQVFYCMKYCCTYFKN